jgi:hypothetical protein
MNRASIARYGSVRPIAEIRQSNDRADQQENHDELGIFNQQGNTQIIMASDRRKISAHLWRECELRHR